MSTTYFELMARLSPEDIFHLERDAHEAAKPALREEKLDQMLDAIASGAASRRPNTDSASSRLVRNIGNTIRPSPRGIRRLVRGFRAGRRELK